MLRAAVRQLRRPLLQALHNKNGSQYQMLNITSEFWMPSVNITTTYPKFAMISKQLNFSDEDTLSNKVLNYIRSHTNFETLDNCDETYSSHYIQQMLLVTAHSSEINASNIIKTFSLYNSSNHSIITDIITKRSLMESIRRKIVQVLPTMNLDELKKYAFIIKSLHSNEHKYLNKLVSDINYECERRALNNEDNLCLELFDILVMLHGNHINRRKQYDVFMSLFENNLESAKPIDLLHILYYIGLGRKKKLNQEFVISTVSQLSKHLDNLSFVDIGIAATSIFKTGVKLNENHVFVQKIAEHLINAFKNYSTMNELEFYAFIGIVKLIRSSRYEGKYILPSCSNFVMEADTNILTSEVLAHILALYTNLSVYEPKVFSKIEDVMLEYFTSPSQLVRIKDVSRVLWGFSHVRHKCSQEFLEECNKTINECVHNIRANSYPEFIAGSLLSMAMLGYYPEKLINIAFEPQKIDALTKGYHRSKVLSRLLMLQKAIQVEQPELNITIKHIPKSNLPMRKLSDELHFRPHLATLMKGAEVLNNILDSPLFQLKFIIPHFNFASLVINDTILKEITSAFKSDSGSNGFKQSSRNHILKQLCYVCEKYEGNEIALELFDSNSIIHDSSELIGMVDLKVRLMKQSGWVVKIVTQDDIDNCMGDIQTVAAVILDVLDKPSL